MTEPKRLRLQAPLFAFFRKCLFVGLGSFYLGLGLIPHYAQAAGPDDRNPPPLPDASQHLPLTVKKWTLRFRSDFFSRYLWNGIAYSEGPVWQPAATFELGGAGMTLWGNFVLGDEANQGQFNELDLTLYYRKDLARWSFQASIIGLLYFNDDPASLNRGPNGLQGYFQVIRGVGPVKLFTDLTVGFLEPAGTIFWDFGISYQRKLPGKFGIDTSLLFGIGDARFNKAYFADVGTQANLLLYSLAIPWKASKGLSLVPSITFSRLLAPSLRRASPTPTVIWGGLSVIYEL